MKPTFENPNIANFFDGTSEEAPTEEMRYIIGKKVTFSFLDEIRSTVEVATKKAERKNIRTHSSTSLQQKFASFLVLLLEGMREDDDGKISRSLLSLREIYSAAVSINNI